MTKQSMKRIHKVTIKRMIDESPDTSWLGEYSNSAESEYSIDRGHDLDCIAQPYNHPTGEASDHLQNAIEYLEEQYEELSNLPWKEQAHAIGCTSHQDTYAPCSCHVQKELDCNTDSRATLESLRDADCNCGERGNVGRNEYRYFNPSRNYDGDTPENIRKYTRQDYERMESLNRGDWCFIGIRAEAQYSIGLVHGDSYLLQDISSGGLWGIESDSNESYFAEVEQEELAELRKQLEGIGFSKRAIAAAFKNIEHETR
jgi:hypothetical protein